MAAAGETLRLNITIVALREVSEDATPSVILELNVHLTDRRYVCLCLDFDLSEKVGSFNHPN